MASALRNLHNASDKDDVAALMAAISAFVKADLADLGGTMAREGAVALQARFNEAVYIGLLELEYSALAAANEKADQARRALHNEVTDLLDLAVIEFEAGTDKRITRDQLDALLTFDLDLSTNGSVRCDSVGVGGTNNPQCALSSQAARPVVEE